MNKIDAKVLNKRSLLKNNIRRMKLLAICLILGLQFSYGENSYSQTTSISINVVGKTVKEVLNEISKKTEFVFIYQDEALDLERRVTANFSGEKVDAILDSLFTDTNNTYVISGRQSISQKNNRYRGTKSPPNKLKKLPGKLPIQMVNCWLV